MQIMNQKIIQARQEDIISSSWLSLHTGERVFLRWDLWAGKTTISRYLIEDFLTQSVAVKSPTYVYYNRYGENIYHFDLYRLTSYDDFINIWGEEILDNPNNICIIEWPELIAPYYAPTIDVEILKTPDHDLREIRINRP